MFVNVPIIERIDGLGKMVWQFHLIDHSTSLELRLNSYYFYEKKSTRHHWKRTHQWERLDHRNDNISTPPPPPPDECDKLIQKVSEMIYVSWENGMEISSGRISKKDEWDTTK